MSSPSPAKPKPMTAKKAEQQSVAVIGSGVAGLAAAYKLAEQGYAVTVFEAADHVGGHSHTMEVDGTPVDVGFMVFNRVTYPNMARA